MRIARIIGLAAIAALALTAMAGAGSAFAAETTLCKTNTYSPTCNAGDRYASGTSIQSSSGSVTISTTAPKLSVTCASKLEGETSAESGEPMSVKVSAWTLSTCNKGCTILANEGAPYSGSLVATTGSNGTLTVGSSGKGDPGWKLICGEVIDCTFSFTPTLDVSGGNPATIVASAESMSPKGSFCPGAATFSGTYSVSTPKPAYVATVGAPHTRLCSAAQSPCESKNTYPAGTKIAAEAPELLLSDPVGGHTITCGKSTMSATTLSIGAEPLPIGPVEFSTTGCVSSLSGNCTVSSSPAAGSSIATTGTYSATVALGGGSLSFQCGGGEPSPCVVGFAGVAASFYGSGIFDAERAAIRFEEDLLTYEGGFCGKTERLTANFTVTSPKPLFAT